MIVKIIMWLCHIMYKKYGKPIFYIKGLKKDKDYPKYLLYTEGEKLFGTNYENWRFKCPMCGNIASGQEFKKVGKTPNDMYCECIGRYVKKIKVVTGRHMDYLIYARYM